MIKQASLFSQLLCLVDRHHFEREVRRWKAERCAKGFSCWSQFVAMMFCQLAQAKSLREIVDGLASCEGKLRHLGLDSGPRRSTLCYANAHRPWQLYEGIFHGLLSLAQSLAPAKRLRFKNRLFSLDATVIDLCLSLFDWAKFRQTKGAIKLHLLLDHDGYLPVFATVSEGVHHELAVARCLDFPKGSIVVMDRGFIDYKLFAKWTDQGVYFVTRLKKKADFLAYQRRPLPKGGLIQSDEIGMLNAFVAGGWWRRQLRVITLWDEVNQRPIRLLTNHLDFAATTIAAIYKERWQIEIFFKTLKQNLKIKTFVGSSANAVRTQIWTALIALLLLKILQFRSRFAWAISNLIALLRWNLFTYRDLWLWIDRPFDIPAESPPQQLDFLDWDSTPLAG
jgi:hypothetical protein